ncbi:L-dopachrome tautomerase-related protein [Acetobacter sp. DsW_059]|uniref:L-dopachrome tautomerase-related protein n=1 Tax=Acetobacter sp. DsW_059 TaxID=1670661 RepID=UPI000A385A6C|nr:L-dopachrome tautomerase-related protein [Acetobacter sp. DsW_059]OUJ08856.1 major royal jelly protein [Acetobacter sp. DsW_059]
MGFMKQKRRQAFRATNLRSIAAMAVFTGVVAVCAHPVSSHAQTIRIEATTTIMDWNAVALAGGRVFVAGPRWTGFSGPTVGLLTKSKEIEPFPDADWNGWQPGQDATHRFVSVNALHVAPDGTLWVVDTGTPSFGGTLVLGGAKLVRIDPVTGHVLRIYPLGPEIAQAGSYIDDIRFNGTYAYLTDAGKAALIVLDIKTGKARRVLDNDISTRARSDRPIIMDGHIVESHPHQPLLVSVDPLEVSPDGKWLYFGPLEGPWSQVPTALLDDPNVSSADLSAAVQPWADLPPIGGSTMDTAGNLYFTNLKDNGVYRRDVSGRVTRLISDPRLHWADAPFLAPGGRLWLPVAQLDRLPMFHDERSRIQQPFLLVSIDPHVIQIRDKSPI